MQKKMSAFRFGNNIVKIEIEDLIFRVIITKELHETLIKNNDKLEMLKKALDDLSDAEKEIETIGGLDGLIDNILGAGAAAEIFGSREPDAFERVAVYIYICDRIKRHIYGFTDNE